MYRVSIYNNGLETLIHDPNPSKEAPHILSLPLTESLSKPEQLSFHIPINNPGFDKLEGIITKVKVFDDRDDSIVFSGRVIPLKDGMTNDGNFHKYITCEGALAYLNDSHTRRWNFTNQTPSQILDFLLTKHNEKMDNSRKIFLGTVNVNQPITIDTNYETTLNAVLSKVKNILGGDIRVQERNGLLYLDYLLAQGTNNGVTVKIAYNLKEIIREYDPMDIITRAIPLGYGEGINQLGIESVNADLEYIEDSTAVAKYGVIEGVVTNKDLQNADTLKIYGNTVLQEKKQPRLTYSQSALDLSVLSGHENEKYELGDTLQTIVEVLNVDVASRVVERERDLLNDPWNVRLTISTRPITLSDQIIDLKQRNLTLENAPQGSTYIDTFGYAESIDSAHNFQLPVWISPDILNVNRVRLHIDGQKYRAYEQGIAAAGSVLGTTSSGGGSPTTSGSSSSATTSGGGGFTTYVDRWGNPNDNISIQAPVGPLSTPEDWPVWYYEDSYYAYDYSSYYGHVTNGAAKSYCYPDAQYGYIAYVDLWELQHKHSSDDHSHGMEHHHTVDIPEHNHTLEIQSHYHAVQYGIFEDTYPKDVYVKINGTNVAGPYGNGTEAFTVDIDLTPYIGQPGQTYNLEITSSQNGRVNAWVSVQAFIQAK